MDVVYVVRPGDINHELRYSLRSLAAHVPHARVWIVGYRPTWVSGAVRYLPTAQTGTKYRNSSVNVKVACSHADVSEWFTLWNDDFYCMAPLDPTVGVPVLHRGPIDRVEAYYAARAQGRYLRGLRATWDRLSDLGYASPLSYELHVPLPVRKSWMLDALAAGRGVPYVHKRTLYGNLHGVGGDQIDDVKVTTLNNDFRRDGVWLSTLPRAFTFGEVGRWIRRRFPDPCRYEKPEGSS